MLEVASEKLTERERECLKHFRQAREGGVSFAEYCRGSGLKASRGRRAACNAQDGRKRAELASNAARSDRKASVDIIRMIPQSAQLYREAVRNLNTTL